MSIRIVTSLFDLASRSGSGRQSADFYLHHGRKLFEVAAAHDLEIDMYCDSELAARVYALGRDVRGLQVYERTLEVMPAWDDLELITQARLTHPFHACNETKDTPLYAVFQRAKMQLLREAAVHPGVDRLAWVDFGIAKAVPLDDLPRALAAAAELDRVQILHHYDLEMPMVWQQIRQNVAAGFIAGPAELIGQFARKFQALSDLALLDGYAPHDETLLEQAAVTSKGIVKLQKIREHARMFTDCCPPLPAPPPPAPVVTTKTEQDLIGLVMIVKDEAHGIADTLRTLKHQIDCWTIYDTGSTDGTKGIIERELEHIPGTYIVGPFNDFSSARNAALSHHAQSHSSVFVFMPDADDQVVRMGEIRAFLETQRHAPDAAYMMPFFNGLRGDYGLPIVMRSSAGWRYSGRVHECAGGPGACTQTIPGGVGIYKTAPPKSAAATRARWERDVEWLHLDLKANPNNARAMYYLAQSYDCLGQHDAALIWYEARAEYADFPSERFVAKLRAGHMMRELKCPWADIETCYLDAYRLDPSRAEPLYEIAKHYSDEDNHPLAFLFAQRAAQLPRPTNAFFVDSDTYRWRASYLTARHGFYLPDAEARAVGYRAAYSAVQGSPSDPDGIPLRANRAFYAPSAAEMLGAKTQRIDFTPEPGYYASNPSIFYYAGSDYMGWRCVVRTHNYKIVNGEYITPEDNVIFTKNVMLDFVGSDMRVKRARHMTEYARVTNLPRNKFPAHGFEDCRLFEDPGEDGGLRCIATVCDLNDWTHLQPYDQCKREMALLTLDELCQICSVHVIRGPWSAHHQKNWMPIEGLPTKFVYDIERSMVIDISDDVPPPGIDWAPKGRLRGGSQVIRIGDRGYLCVVHDVTHSGNARTYLHRFAFLSPELELKSLSDLFYFEKRGIEFCAGLAVEGGRLIASYSVDDHNASLATFSLERVMAALRTNYVV